ncbi:MFS transporter [Nocardia terpenica]|uniref:MFS transporter n=1 Tax=Nocardia terpenica TaxID=455432 RepID=UPI0018958287|nr:MFS transporter [Nocardia terpenica]MBF6059414.1 MFS transporter [Nocardia terpenica]MBF6103047.1 MFS transporter [Nocardia terpenica]MBF6110764.1 MFS transporter [Nocardia terpenica]MBF6116895.1 MFS transporter [Nocardia terpenica]MBF6151267.1 MFS transporter [Nocardia terpenica]
MNPVVQKQHSRTFGVARVASWVAYGLHGFLLGVVFSEAPRLRGHFDLSKGAIATLIGMVSLLAIVGSLLAGKLTLRWSSRTTLRIGLALLSVGGCAVALAPDIVFLCGALSCYGIAVGLSYASANAQAVFVQRGYGRFVLSSFYAAGNVGIICGSLFVSVCAKSHVTLRESLLAGAMIVFVASMVAGPRLLGPHDAEHNSAGEQQKVHARSNAAHADRTPLRAYLVFGIAIALMSAIDVTISDWSALYLTDDLMSAPSTAALALAAYQAASLLGRFTGDRWIRRFGPRAVLRAAAGSGIVGLAVAVAASNPALAIVGFGITGFGLPLITPLCVGEAGRLTSGQSLDSLIARLMIFPYLGTVLGSVTAGGIAAATTLRIGFALPLACAISLTLFGRAFHPRHEPDADLATGRDRNTSTKP